MVLHEGFNIRVCKRGTDSYYPDFHEDGKAYVVAVPNQEFTIQIAAPNNLADRLKDGQGLLFVLSIDGECVGYSHGIRPGRTVVFDGFLTGRETLKASKYQTTMTKAVYRHFKFASTLDANSSLQTASSHLGEIKVSLKLGSGKKLRNENYHRDITPVSNKAPEDGKKFFMAPSLRTQPGTTESREGGAWTSYRTAVTVWEFVLHYETAATLLLRKVLEPANPAHAAIISLTNVLNDRSQVHREDGPPIATVMQDTSCKDRASPSRHTRIKRETDCKGPQRPKQVCGVDEDLVCDLTGISAKWEVRKKPRVEEINLL